MYVNMMHKIAESKWSLEYQKRYSLHITTTATKQQPRKRTEKLHDATQT